MASKKGLKATLGAVGTALIGVGVAAIWVLKQVPKVVKFVLNNKFKSLLAAAAIYFGYGKVKETIRYNRDVDNEVNRIRAEVRLQEQARQNREQNKAELEAAQKPAPVKAAEPTNATTNAPAATASTNAPAKPAAKKLHPMQIATKQVVTDPVKTNSVPTPVEEAAAVKAKKETKEAEELTQEAAEATAKNAFVSSPTMDMAAKSGSRAAPAEMRFRHFLNKGAKENGSTDVGDNTILICSQKDPKNHVVLYLGFRNAPKRGNDAYVIYYTSAQTKTGYLPFIGGFNVQFNEVSGLRMGLTLSEKGMTITNFQKKSPVINVTRNSGRTLMHVDENGGLHRVYDPQVVEQAFAQVDQTQTAEIQRQRFNLYDDAGRSKQQVNVPRPSINR